MRVQEDQVRVPFTDPLSATEEEGVEDGDNVDFILNLDEMEDVGMSSEAI